MCWCGVFLFVIESASVLARFNLHGSGGLPEREVREKERLRETRERIRGLGKYHPWHNGCRTRRN